MASPCWVGLVQGVELEAFGVKHTGDSSNHLVVMPQAAVDHSTRMYVPYKRILVYCAGHDPSREATIPILCHTHPLRYGCTGSASRTRRRLGIPEASPERRDVAGLLHAHAYEANAMHVAQRVRWERAMGITAERGSCVLDGPCNYPMEIRTDSRSDEAVRAHEQAAACSPSRRLVAGSRTRRGRAWPSRPKTAC